MFMCSSEGNLLEEYLYTLVIHLYEEITAYEHAEITGALWFLFVLHVVLTLKYQLK